MPEFTPPASPPNHPSRPKVLIYFYIYISIMLVLSIALFVLSLIILQSPPDQNIEGAPPQSLGQLLAVYAIILAILFTPAYFIPPNRFKWVYAIILLCLGLLNMCLWPISIPILIFWCLPPNRRYHNLTPIDVYHRKHFGPDSEPPKH